MSTPSDLPRIDGHEVLRELGRGAMGAVYLARDLTLRREVAVKVLLGAELANAEALARFRHESEAVARLRHPAIVQVFSSGQTDGVPWFSMEYVEGAPLSTALRTGSDRIRPAAALVETVARALHHAHQQGIVHRDVKPANILVDAAGRPFITDFGIAKWYRPQDGGASKRMTSKGTLLGTAGYMSPEQARGDVEAVGPATDVWALGVVLYELLAGTSPFRGETVMTTLGNIVSDDPIPPAAAHRTDVPAALEAIVARCLERNRDARYPSAAALADDLAAFLLDRPRPSDHVDSSPRGFLKRLFRRE